MTSEQAVEQARIWAKADDGGYGVRKAAISLANAVLDLNERLTQTGHEYEEAKAYEFEANRKLAIAAKAIKQEICSADCPDTCCGHLRDALAQIAQGGSK